MILKSVIIMIGKYFLCGDCPAMGEFKSVNAARKAGWAVNGKTCYCPNCAPARRNVGCKGGKRKGIQLTFNNISEGI